MGFLDNDGVSQLWGKIKDLVSDRADSDHKHSALDITSDSLPVERGGTGKTTAQDSANVFFNSLSIGTTTLKDSNYFIVQNANGVNTYHRKTMSVLWNYIKGKISSVLGLTATDYKGNSATATKLTTSAGSTTQPVYFSDGVPVEIDIDIPTKTSQLTNDSGFITEVGDNTTYTLSKSGSTITLTGSDGSTSSVSDSDTDKKVTQTANNTSNYRLVLLGYKNGTDPTALDSTVTNGVYVNEKIYVQPSTGDFFATSFNGDMDGGGP